MESLWLTSFEPMLDIEIEEGRGELMLWLFVIWLNHDVQSEFLSTLAMPEFQVTRWRWF